MNITESRDEAFEGIAEMLRSVVSLKSLPSFLLIIYVRCTSLQVDNKS